MLASGVQGIFARNFYTFKLVALALAFAINIMLLFFKVHSHCHTCSSIIGGSRK